MQNQASNTEIAYPQSEEDEQKSKPPPKPLYFFISKLYAKLLKRQQDDSLGEILKHRTNGGKTISGGESEMIQNVLNAGDLTVDDVMIPSADVASIAYDMSLDDVLDFINEEPHTRYAVYGKDADDILGMVHIKDVLAELAKRSKRGGVSGEVFSLESIFRPILFVAPSMRALDLLLRMRIDGLHMAMVVDEYGGIDGQITLSDLVEEVIGDIRDEHDKSDAEPSLTILSDGIYLVDARYGLDELQSEIGIFYRSLDGKDVDIDTIGGLVTTLAGRVPLTGEVIRDESCSVEFQIVSADPRRIHRLRIYRHGGGGGSGSVGGSGSEGLSDA